MKKIIALSLSISTIIFCGWMIISKLGKLDIVPNYTDTFASEEKRKIVERTDIDDCEKKILINQVDQNRTKFREISNEAFQTQIILFIIIVIQLILLIFILMIPNKLKNYNLSIQIDE